MRIAHITPGAGGMLCGACLHDNTLAGALMKEGLDVALIPIYTPIRTDEKNVSSDRVFYGALNVYLKERSRFYRRLPSVLTGLLNRPGVLRLLARVDSTIDAGGLGALTVSMLQGEHGHQAQELEDLVDWLRDHYRPDVVHLSNSLLLGMAPRLRDGLGVPVVCSLQGEEIFLQDLKPPYGKQVEELMRRRAADVDAFVAPCARYALHMADFLGVPAGRIHHVPLGLKMEGHGGHRPPESSATTIGYLARICPEKGLHLLVDAFIRLAGEHAPGAVRLRVAGYLGGRDKAYFSDIKSRVAAARLGDVVDFVGEVDRPGKIRFFQSLDILSVPTTYHEPKGLFVLEAMANGTPVVQPDHGAFPDMLAATGGGVLFRPGDVADLARTLTELVADPRQRRLLGQRGRLAVTSQFTDAHMARRMAAIYQQLTRAADDSALPAGERL